MMYSILNNNFKQYVTTSNRINNIQKQRKQPVINFDAEYSTHTEVYKKVNIIIK